MITEYVIHPIPLIVLKTDMPKMPHPQNYGQKVDTLIYTWYLERILRGYDNLVADRLSQTKNYPSKARKGRGVTLERGIPMADSVAAVRCDCYVK